MGIEVGAKIEIFDGTETGTYTILEYNEDEGMVRWLNEATGEEEVEPMWVLEMWEVRQL